MKKALCLILCLCLCLTILPLRVQGETTAVITFDPGDFGTLSSKRAFVPTGSQIGILPIPVNQTLEDGDFNRQFFVGWYSEDGETPVGADYTVTGDVTFYARWETADPMPFSDVSAESWYASAVDYCSSLQLVSGTSKTTFSPSVPCTRGMIVTLLYRMAGSPVVQTSVSPFTDVPTGTWYSAAVLWAAEQGIAAGVGDGRFAPNKTVTREEFACFIKGYAEYSCLCDPHAYKNLTAFSDEAEVSDWAYESLRWVVGSGLIRGRTDGKQTLLAPKGTLTRGEAVTVLFAYLKNTDCAESFFCLPYAVTVPNLWRGSVTARACENGIAFYSTASKKADMPLFSVLFSPLGETPESGTVEVFGRMYSNETDRAVCAVLLYREDTPLPEQLVAEVSSVITQWHNLAIYSHHAYFKATG